VNFEVIKAIVLGQGESVVNVHTEHNIKRKRRAGGVVDLVMDPENKRYRISFFKGWRMPDHRRYLSAVYIYIGDLLRCEGLVTELPSMGDVLIFKHPFSC